MSGITRWLRRGSQATLGRFIILCATSFQSSSSLRQCSRDATHPHPFTPKRQHRCRFVRCLLPRSAPKPRPMASGGLVFRTTHWICHAPPRIAMGREQRCRDGQQQDLALLVRGRHTLAGSSILRASPECGLTTATAASFLRLKRRAGQILAGRLIPVAFHVRCRRKYFHVCRNKNRRRCRRMNDRTNKSLAPARMSREVLR